MGRMWRRGRMGRKGRAKVVEADFYAESRRLLTAWHHDGTGCYDCGQDLPAVVSHAQQPLAKPIVDQRFWSPDGLGLRTARCTAQQHQWGRKISRVCEISRSKCRRAVQAWRCGGGGGRQRRQWWRTGIPARHVRPPQPEHPCSHLRLRGPLLNCSPWPSTWPRETSPLPRTSRCSG